MPRFNRARFTLPRQSAQPAGDAELWDLVEQARDGDGWAFVRFHDATAIEVFGYVCRRLCDDRGSAEEITSDVYVAAWRNLDSVRRVAASPAAWLMTIAKRRVIDYHRSRQRRPVVPAGGLSDLSELAAIHPEAAISGVGLTDRSAESVCVERAEARALTRALWAHVRLLSADQHRVLRCRFELGLSVEDTAAALGKPPTAVKSLQHRAMVVLRGRLAGTSLDPGGRAPVAAAA